MTYVPLHLHTNFSPDGLGTIDNMMQYASAIGFNTLAITDHGTCAGHVSFWSSAKNFGIKSILGNELYILYNGKRGHITCLARNRTGYENLLKLNNHSYTQKDRGFPVVTLDDISLYSDGLIFLSGCSASPLYSGTEYDAVSFAGSLYDIVGKGNFYAEVMGVIAEDNYSRPKIISERLGIPLLITNDTHFARKIDYNAHTIMCISRKGFDYSSKQLYLKSYDEILNTGFLKQYAGSTVLKELLQNTVVLADEIEHIDLSASPLLPSASSSIDIISIARENSTNERLEYEISVIEKQGLVDYFTILYDIVLFCKKNSIKIGPGRGSGAGSCFLYRLGITDIDPIENGLLFERFLNPGRSDLPDFDLDIETNRRDEVIHYANEKWGAFPIANYSTYSHASLIRDIGRFFSVPISDVNKYAETEDEAELEVFFQKCNTKHTTAGVSRDITPSDARRAYEVMLGQVRHRGKHAGGVVITTRPVPIEDGLVAWTEGIKDRQLSTAGLVKYDILGVTALSQLAEMESITGLSAGSPWDSDSEDVYKSIFHSGRVEGIFQFGGSSGIVELTKLLKPSSLSELSAINALYRPGPLDSGMTFKYPDYKKNPRKVHPDIDGVLEETFGTIVYQEQVMEIVSIITGGSLADSDNARKIISKGKKGDPVWEAKMRELELHFKTKGAIKYKEIVNSLWDEIVTFGRYGFNKSHSSAYSLVSYRMAWFKHYHPYAFYTALLNGDQENADTWLYSAAIDGIKVKHPDINTSGVKWVTDSSAIYAPLTALKFFGEKQATEFVGIRNSHGVFRSFEELEKIVPKRVINSRVRKQLYLGGALNNISGNILSYIPELSGLTPLNQSEREIEAMGFRLPGDSFVDFFNKEAKLGKMVGFVSEVEKRNKGRGDYFVVRLSPKNSFWTKRPADKLSKWDLISADVNDKGEATSITRRAS